jgi:GAF domain-containing protein
LNVYAKDTNQLGDNDANQLRLVANQVAGILRNARTLAEKEQSLAALQAIQNRYLAQNWEQYRRSTRTLQVQAQQEGEALAINQPLSNSLEHAKQAALKQGHTFSLNPLPLQNTLPQADADTPAPAPKQPEAVLVTPLMLGDQVLGTLGIRDKGSAQAWSENDVAFVEAVAQQVAQALENARLFNETQLRASRERLTREITDKMRQAPDLDSIVNIGLRELTQVLGVSRSYVKLTVQNSSDVSGAEAAEASPPNTQVAERE